METIIKQPIYLCLMKLIVFEDVIKNCCYKQIFAAEVQFLYIAVYEKF